MKSKKLLSIILALAMMFSVLPASTVLVYADEITETISADTTWNDGDTVGGVTISGGTVTINGDVGITAARRQLLSKAMLHSRAAERLTE